MKLHEKYLMTESKSHIDKLALTKSTKNFNINKIKVGDYVGFKDKKNGEEWAGYVRDITGSTFVIDVAYFEKDYKQMVGNPKGITIGKKEITWHSKV